MFFLILIPGYIYHLYIWYDQNILLYKIIYQINAKIHNKVMDQVDFNGDLARKNPFPGFQPIIFWLTSSYQGISF